MPRHPFRLSGKTRILGVEMSEQGAALVRSASNKNTPRIIDADFCTWREEEERSRALSRKVRELGAHRTPVVSTLSPQTYQLLQIQAPNVKDSEMRMAVGWQIKDLIDYPLQNTVIDYFPAPDSPGLGKMVYVVAAEKRAVQEQADLLQSARLKIESIDIAELALRNIVLQQENSDAGLALLHMEQVTGLILIFKNKTLYVARRLRSGLSHLLQSGSAEPENSEILESEEQEGAAFESVLLDLQRTLDYFESNFRAPPVGNLFLAPQLGDIPELQSHLQNNLDLSVRLLDIAQLLGEDLSYAEQGRCLLALGSALRSGEG